MRYLSPIILSCLFIANTASAQEPVPAQVDEPVIINSEPVPTLEQASPQAEKPTITNSEPIPTPNPSISKEAPSKTTPAVLRHVIDITPKPAAAPKVHHNNYGFGMDVGVPQGIAIGFVVRPNVDWFRLELAGTYNVISPGFRGGLTIDPINFFISPSLTIEGGYMFPGNIPGKAANINLAYANFYGGIELGSRKSFRFFIHGGPSYFSASGSNIESLFANKASVKLANTSIGGWFTPTAQMGFVCLF